MPRVMIHTVFIDQPLELPRKANTGTELPQVGLKIRTAQTIAFAFMTSGIVAAVAGWISGKCVIKAQPTCPVLLIDTTLDAAGADADTRYNAVWTAATLDGPTDGALRQFMADATAPKECWCEVEWIDAGGTHSVSFPITLVPTFNDPEDVAPDPALSASWDWLKAALAAGSNITLDENDTTKVITVTATGSAGGGTDWGGIGGTLSNQTDLQTALNAKLSTTTAAGSYQPLVTDGSLTIAQTNGLQAALNAKLSIATAESDYLTAVAAAAAYQPNSGNLDELSFYGSSLGGHGASDATKVAKYGNAGELGASGSILIYGDVALNVTTLTAQAGVNPTVLLPSTGGTLALTSDNITGTAAGLSEPLSLATGVSGDLPFANLTPATAAAKLLGRGSASGAGDYQEITVGSGLTMTGTTLSASGGGGGGKLAQRVCSEDATQKTSTATIPWDDTLPQSNEGTAYDELNVVITPTSASSALYIEVQLAVYVNSLQYAAAAVFRDAETDCLASNWIVLQSAGYPGTLTIRKKITAGGTSAQTFKVRFGRISGTPTIYLNDYTTPYFGGSQISSMTVTEVLP